jgi:hypothetical protein
VTLRRSPFPHWSKPTNVFSVLPQGHLLNGAKACRLCLKCQRVLLPRTLKKKLGGAVEDENYDVEKGKKIIRPPVHLKFDVDPPERLALEDDQRKVSYETEHKLISDALKEEKKDYEKSVGESKDQEMLVKNDVDHVEKNTNAKRTD